MNVLNIGDKVAFLNESLNGVITSLKGNGNIGVTIEDDFELEVKPSDVVVTETSVHKLEDKINSGAKSKIIEPENKLKPELYWYFTENKDGFDLHIANLRDFPYLFTSYRKGFVRVELAAEGKVEAGEYKKLLELKGRDKNKWGGFEILLLPVRQLPSVMPSALKAELNLPADFLQNPSGKTKGINYWVIALNAVKNNEQIKEIEEVVEINVNPIQYSISRPDEVVDLHANSLGLEGLPADDILKKQMDAFHKNLELAIAYKMPKIIFIHGIGTGVLKNIITLAVKGNKHVSGILQADPNKYGQGAVEIRLKN